jgi:hypothetical protein
MIKKFFKKITGLQALEDAKVQADAERVVAEKLASQAIAEAAAAKLSAKDLANEKGEPYVAVLETKVNADNPRNGFFELDWNEHFVAQLKNAGYTGETEEEIVDQWFQDLCRNVGAESGVSMDRRGSGYINVNKLDGNRSEIS